MPGWIHYGFTSAVSCCSSLGFNSILVENLSNAVVEQTHGFQRDLYRHVAGVNLELSICEKEHLLRDVESFFATSGEHMQQATAEWI